MKVFILTPTLATGDAVGNSVIQEYHVLSAQGYEVKLYASHCDKDYMPYLVPLDMLIDSVRASDAFVIYHHSIQWEEGGSILKEANCKIILRYHNITPEHFFFKYSDLFVDLSREGRHQLKGLVTSGKIHYYVADSDYNAAELFEIGAPQGKVSVLAPFHKISDFEESRINLKLLESLLDGCINVLYVGRVVPNKGLHHSIGIIDRYMEYYGDNLRFNIVGGFDPNFQKYADELENLVSRCNLNGYVSFHGKIDFADLRTFYAASHVFLLTSEHEGFCLPILEAQYHKLPVIALDRGAVKDTLGQEHLSFKDIDYDLFAAALHIVCTDNDVRNYLADRGRTNYLKYHFDVLSREFLRIINDNR